MMMLKVALCLALYAAVVAGQCSNPQTQFVCVLTGPVSCGGNICNGVCTSTRRCTFRKGKVVCFNKPVCNTGSIICGPGTCPPASRCQPNLVCPSPPPPPSPPAPVVPLADVVSSSLSDALGTVTYTDAVANGGNAYTGAYATGDYSFSRSDSGAFDDGTAVAYTDVDSTLGYEAEANAFATSNPRAPRRPSQG